MVGSRSSSRTRARALRWPTPLTQLCCCGELASKNAPPLLPSTGVPRGPAPQEGVPQPLRRAPVRAGELRCVGEQREGVMCALLLRLVRVAPRARARAQCAATESCAAACAHTVHHSRSSSHPLTPPPCTTNRIPTTAPGAQARARHHHHEHWRAGDALGCAERLALPTLFFRAAAKKSLVVVLLGGGCTFPCGLRPPFCPAPPLPRVPASGPDNNRLGAAAAAITATTTARANTLSAHPVQTASSLSPPLQPPRPAPKSKTPCDTPHTHTHTHANHPAPSPQTTRTPPSPSHITTASKPTRIQNDQHQHRPPPRRQDGALAARQARRARAVDGEGRVVGGARQRLAQL